jgi:hypothetical protein
MTEYEDVVDSDEAVEGEDELDIYGAAARAARAAAKKTARPGGGTMTLVFPRTTCLTVAAQDITAKAVRKCRPVDIRVRGSVAATGVAAPGILIRDLSVHGTSLFNSKGDFDAELFGPGTGQTGFNCDVPEVIGGGEEITLTVYNVTVASISVSATMLCRSVTR